MALPNSAIKSGLRCAAVDQAERVTSSTTSDSRPATEWIAVTSSASPSDSGGSNPGLIQPGYLIEVNDIGHTWRGLVRGIRVTAGLPTVRQTITVEREAVTP